MIREKSWNFEVLGCGKSARVLGWPSYFVYMQYSWVLSIANVSVWFRNSSYPNLMIFDCPRLLTTVRGLWSKKCPRMTSDRKFNVLAPETHPECSDGLHTLCICNTREFYRLRTFQSDSATLTLQICWFLTTPGCWQRWGACEAKSALEWHSTENSMF